jgi:hypothetical protein
MHPIQPLDAVPKSPQSFEATRLFAVITGDIVASSRLSSEDRRKLAGILKLASKEIAHKYPDLVSQSIDVFRGDSWQLVLTDPTVSLTAAVLFRASVIAASPSAVRIDTRLAIGIGTIDYRPPNRVSEGNGEAYRASGRALDSLKGSARMKYVTAEPIEQNPLLGTTVELLDAIIQEWTIPQALAVKGGLLGLTQLMIAKQWPKRITQQTIARHLARAHWPAVTAALEAVENSP